MKKRTVVKMVSYLMAAAMIIGGIGMSPIAKAEAQAAAGVRTVNLNVNNQIVGITDPVSTSGAADKWEGSRVYIANRQWRVLDNDHSSPTVDSSQGEEGYTFLLSEELIMQMTSYQRSLIDTTWENSDIRRKMNGVNNSGSSDTMLGSLFSYAERIAIGTLTIPNPDVSKYYEQNPNYCHVVDGGNPTTDGLFLLSQFEAENSAYGLSNAKTRTNVDGKGFSNISVYGTPTDSAGWWLRSPGLEETCAQRVNAYGNIGTPKVTSPYGFYRPALNLSMSAIRFSTDADVKKATTFSATSDAGEKTVWKLTLKGGGGFLAERVDGGSALTAGTNVKVKVKSLGVEFTNVDYTQISAMLLDSRNTVLAYGKVSESYGADTGEYSFKIPTYSGTATKLLLFAEDINSMSSNMTDYASNMVDVSRTPVTVTKVSISPAKATVVKGKTQTFKAAVTGTGNPAQTVTWKVEGKKSSKTKITSAGLLTVGSDETATTLTVRATSTVNSGKSGTAAVTVKAAETTDPRKANCIAFVTRMYQNTLGRKPDEAGLNYWVNGMMQGSESGASLAVSFIQSAEFIAGNHSDDEYVKILYRAFFGREYDEPGYLFWMDSLRKGASRKYVLSEFVKVKEYQNMCDNCGIKYGSYVSDEARDRNPQLTAYLARCYTEALGRTFDVGGLNYWSELILSKKVSAKDAAIFFVRSKEFTDKNLSNEEYIKVLYKTYFGRDFDQSGFDYWRTALNTKQVTRDDALVFFANSAEFAGILASFGVQ